MTVAHEAVRFYRITVEGRLGVDWSGWFGGMAIHSEAGGKTVIQGSVVDQAALHGILCQIRNLGLPLVSVVRLTPGQGREDGAR